MPDCNMTQFTVHPPTVWPFNIIRCGFEWRVLYASLRCDIMWWMLLHCTQSTLLLYDQAFTQYTVHPPTVWPFNTIRCGFEWRVLYASLRCDIMWWMLLHCTQTTLSQHSYCQQRYATIPLFAQPFLVTGKQDHLVYHFTNPQPFQVYIFLMKQGSFSTVN